MTQIKYEDKTELVLFLSLKQEHYFDVINYRSTNQNTNVIKCK